MGNNDREKDKELHSEEEAMEGATGTACDARQATQDLSQEKAAAME